MPTSWLVKAVPEVPMTRFRYTPLTVAVLLLGPKVGLARAADKPALHSFDAGGVKIAYFVQGKGEPIVLIHGWLSSAGINWALRRTSDLLARDHQVIAMDVRGHGLSDKPAKEEAYGPELVEDVVRLLDHLKIQKAHIVGYSMGGIIAANFLARHPDRVLSGTLGGAGWLRQGGPAQFGFAHLGKNNRKTDSAGLCFRSLGKLALTEKEVKSIKVPVAVLIGDQDDLTKKLYVDPLYELRRDWPIIEIKDANHLTCIVKTQFRDEIAAWINRNTR